MSGEEFILVDHTKYKNCNDYADYDFVQGLDGCKQALGYFKTAQPTLVKSPVVYDNSRTKTARPYGCYWYRWGKKLVHPRNTKSVPGLDSDATTRQVCERKTTLSTEEENKNYRIVSNGKNCQEKRLAPLNRDECEKAIQSLGQTPLSFQTQRTNVDSKASLQTTDSSDRRPPGCYVYQNEIWFNENASLDGGGCDVDGRYCLCSSTELSENNTETNPPAAQTARPDAIPATKIPYCQITRGTETGEDVVVTEEIYSCPAQTSIFCQDGYILDDANKGCKWSKGTEEPDTPPPKPLCRPTEEKIVFSSICGSDQITEESCKGGVECVRENEQTNCRCPEDADVVKVTCRKKEIRTEERVGVFDCGKIGHTLACPEGYRLDNATKLCMLRRQN